MADFSIDFSTLAEQTKWGKEALKSALLANINDGIKNELMLRELPSSLDALMTLCIWVDDRVCAHQSAHTRSGHEPLSFHGTSTTASGLRDSDTCFRTSFIFPLVQSHGEDLFIFRLQRAGSPLACTPQPAH